MITIKMMVIHDEAVFITEFSARLIANWELHYMHISVGNI